MPRPDRSAERRQQLVPVLASAFAELGYRRATTAELAGRCGVAETALYRLWPDKRAMFLAAIAHVFERSLGAWWRLLGEGQERARAASRVLAYESEHLGEHGLYRIIFAGLSEADDPEIRSALRDMYRRFQGFVRERLAEHRAATGQSAQDADLAAWAILGLGTVATIGRELELLAPARRRALLSEVGGRLLDAPAPRAAGPRTAGRKPRSSG